MIFLYTYITAASTLSNKVKVGVHFLHKYNLQQSKGIIDLPVMNEVSRDMRLER